MQPVFIAATWNTSDLLYLPWNMWNGQLNLFYAQIELNDKVLSTFEIGVLNCFNCEGLPFKNEL